MSPPSSKTTDSPQPFGIEISPSEFQLFRELILEKTGISLRDSKTSLLNSRLAKRLHQHGFKTFDAYYQFLREQDISGDEHTELINSITTNKTSFFREKHHFDFLASHCRKEFFPSQPGATAAPLDIWSAACSTGEEPYSIAITLHQICSPRLAGTMRILASDIDTHVLRSAEKGIYHESSIEDVPVEFRQRYFLRGAGKQAGFVRIKPEIRSAVTFSRLNFVDANWPVKSKFDFIFCRNALIYFDPAMQDRILRKMLNYLKPGGYLIVGHSEHLHWMSDVLDQVGITMYQLKKAL